MPTAEVVAEDDRNEGERLRNELRRRLLAGRAKLPTSMIGRAGRTATVAWRLGRSVLARRRAVGGGDGSDGHEVPDDIEEIARIVGSLGQLKGIDMKVGQILSYIDFAMPQDLRNALSVLQTHAQPMPGAEVVAVLRRELGERADDLLPALEAEPIAAASIGQVHRSRLPDGEPVAVKVQYPGVERAIRADLKPAGLGGAISSIIYPGAEVRAFIAEARARFLEECDYLHEAAAQRRFAALHEGHPVIAVPAVHDAYCSRRVLTSSWLAGSHLDTFLAGEPPQETRDRIGEALFGFYVGTLFQHGLYNCDPHPGNYLFLEDGRVGMVDYGCTREFERPFVAKLARLTCAVQRDDRDLLLRSFAELGLIRERRRADFETARGLVRAFYGPMLRDEIQTIDVGEARSMREVLASKRKLMKLSLPSEFLFLFRIRFGLMSVLARLGARANWHQQERRWAECE